MCYYSQGPREEIKSWTACGLFTELKSFHVESRWPLYPTIINLSNQQTPVSLFFLFLMETSQCKWAPKSGKAKLMSSPFFFMNTQVEDGWIISSGQLPAIEREIFISYMLFGMAISISQSHCWHQGRTIIMSAFLSFVAAGAAASLRPFLAGP